MEKQCSLEKSSTLLIAIAFKAWRSEWPPPQTQLFACWTLVKSRQDRSLPRLRRPGENSVPFPPGPREEQPAPETNMDKNLRRKKSLTEIPFVQSWYEQHKYVSSPTYEMKEIDRKYHRYKILVSNQIKSNRIKSNQIKSNRIESNQV